MFDCYCTCGTEVSIFLPHFDVICDLLLNRRTTTWNLFVKYNYIYIYIYWFFITRSEGRDYTLWINEEKISCHQCNKITGTNFEVPSKTIGNRSALWDHSGQIFSGKTQEKASVSKAVIFHLFYFTIDSIIVTHSFLWFNFQPLFHFLVF